MERTTNKNYMYNLELQSLHYWYKRAIPQNPLIKYNNVMKIMQNTIYSDDIIDVNNQDFKKSHINFHNRVILRTIFEHWKMYVIHKLHSRRAVYKANYFYHKKLQRKVLNALCKNVLLKWKHIFSSTNNCTNKLVVFINDKKAEVHCNRVLLKRYFTYWYKLMTTEFKASSLLQKAIAFYDLHCLKKCMKYWIVYIKYQKQKKLMQDKIDEARNFYTKKILQRCIEAWLRNSEFTFQKPKIENAVLHYENKLLKKYFSVWKTYYNSKIQKLIINARVQEYYKKKLMKQYFEQFIMHIKESVISKIAQQKAEMFYNMKCMQKGFFAWQKWYYEKLQRTERMNAIKSIFENQRKRSTFDNWCLYIHDKKCRRRKTFSSHNFYKKKLLSRALKSLYNYTIYRKEKQLKLSYLNEKSMMITYYLQNIYIKKWIRSLYIAIQEKRKLHEAIEFWQTNLFRKYFFYWKKFSEKHKTKNIYKNELNKLASDFLLKKYIVHWRDKLQNTLEMKKKEMFIKSIINQRILRKYLSFWKQYILQKAAKRNNIEAAKEMYKKFLLRDGLKKVVKYTLHNIEQKHCLQLENAAIRSFKNFEVLKEYFDKWQSIIYLKNKSKSLHKVISNTDFQLPYSDTSCNIHCGIKNIGLVLPEYMKEEDTISIIPDCVMFPLENRSFNFFQSH